MTLNRFAYLPVLGACLMMPAHADTLLGLYAGAQGWDTSADGGFANSSDVTEFSLSDETLGTFYLALEHPVPLLPNLKVRSMKLDNTGNATLSDSFEFGGEVYPANTMLNTQMEIDAIDYILYYELFDNDIVSFDFGLNAKDVDGFISVADAADPSLEASQVFSGIVPLVYGKLEVGMPLTGWGLLAEGNFLSIDDSTLYDYQAAVTYRMLDNLAVDLTLQLGYRAFVLELDDLDNTYTDLRFKGPYAGLEVHF
ncbi:TIGR04219 family outer membrane beta-barrel protein [Bowmanella dokdonensis]|uniref:TIGR04219 family outer membrane beta-barrel protein n=1 Tax=Bowmanella dokdonensis TaxID=751969 RepID=A0A939DR31_9ALTE|nr:TIGR04219 family outer membrane beta-barrel protein [Bowmanella dokdonensis]MBN7827418.1 TIGR04219 family outer membrane beta-barrel protein [Bowmanella dokdonensis]